MKVDLCIGLVGFSLGLALGYDFISSLIIFFAAFALDADLIVNELIRIIIFKKKFDLKNILDEQSYTHRFLFHLPLVVLPIVLVSGYFYQNWTYGWLIFLIVLGHLFHDTRDFNFDGIRWLFPFNSISYKICYKTGKFYIEGKTAEELLSESQEFKRNSSEIFKANQ